MTVKQIDCVERKFFQHLMDLVFESFKLFSISKSEVERRVIYTNPEVVNNYFDRGQSVIIAAGHYNNWEYVAASLDIPLKHQTFGIYKKLSNPYFDGKMIESRGRFGMKLISTKEVKESFAREKNNLTAFVFGFDQSPSPVSVPYWIKFLNQDTAAQFGTEKYAKEYEFPVIYGRMNKVKRGYYKFEFEEVCVKPSATIHGEITERINYLLEEDIRRQPEFWLWSHKRWKLKKS
jgi:KDO2-lipid IV(A) lauroyltransferase